MSEFEGRVDRDVPLSGLTWFRLGGEAKYVVSPRGETQLRGLTQRAEAMGVPWRVLGSGANVLVRDDGVDGIVVRLDDAAFKRVTFEDEQVTAGGGADLTRLCNECVRRGLAGLECMAGIPGTVGGAIHMNAGGRFVIVDQLAPEEGVAPSSRVHWAFRGSLRDPGFAYPTQDQVKAMLDKAGFRNPSDRTLRPFADAATRFNMGTTVIEAAK